MPRVTTIPATRQWQGNAPATVPVKRKVAGYARVSTANDEQFTSYEAQVEYYTRFIRQHPDWEFVKIYTDEGISATNTIHRLGFQEMIKDALDGKIDLIVTKSVSRFARNTVDSLTTVRMLKDKGIEIYFEKENIWTLDSKGELLITIMSSLAQEESRSISENTKWGHRKRFADGVVSINTGILLGYRKIEKGKYEIVEEEARVIRYIYSEFLAGAPIAEIARALKAKGILTARGCPNWSHSTLKSILSNERYTGNALLQKTIGVDFLTKKRKINEGEAPQYYVEGSHPAIIEQKVFDAVQVKLKDPRKTNRNGDPFSGIIFCAECGSIYSHTFWHGHGKYRKGVWQCLWKYKKKQHCTTPHLADEELKEIAVTAINTVLSDKKRIISSLRKITGEVFSTAVREKELSALLSELDKVEDLLNNAYAKMRSPEMNQSEATEEYETLSKQYSNLITKRDTLRKEIEETKAKRLTIELYIEALKQQKKLLVEFNPELVKALVDRIIVHTNSEVEVIFKDNHSFKTFIPKTKHKPSR